MKQALNLWSVALAFAVLAIPVESRAGEAAEAFSPAAWRLENRALVVELSEGARRLRLQVRGDDGESWETLTLAHLDGRSGFFKLRLPDGVAIDDLRVEVSASDPFPYSFYQGATRFAHSADSSNDPNRGLINGDAAFNAAPETGDSVTVEESDIWKWRDRTLYFFNTYRGLQVFDLTDPASPTLEASLRMPAVGEQMYLVGDEHVVLLANDPRSGWWSNGAAGSEIVVVHHTGEALEVTRRFPVEGSLVESRLVGDRLFAVTRTWEQFQDDEEVWRVRSGIVVNVIDFADPEAPVAGEPLALVAEDDSGYWYNAVVTATPDVLFVAPSRYDPATRRWLTELRAIDISDPAAPLEVTHTIPLRGRLNDKFKLRLDGSGILTTVTQVSGAEFEPFTAVETFDLGASVGVTRIAALDSVALAPGETVRATRFDGDRLYVVTFRQVDPLFMVDLADPRNLEVLAELEIPGWSTYLEPLGPRLLSVGVEGRRVAVSLFDVSTPESLAMLERVFLGEEGGYSWSEANYDEKAVGWFAGEGLLVLPFGGYDGSGYRDRMQLIDVRGDSLVKRGVIDAEFNARRSRLFDGRTLVAISGRELKAVDVADRDAPEVAATLEIAWPAERVVSIGGYLVQFEHGSSPWWNGEVEVAALPARMRVTPADAPDEVVGELALETGGQVAGAVADGRTLHVITTRTEGREVVDEATGEARWEYASVLESHVVDLGDPEAPVERGSAEVRLPDRWFYGGFEGRFLSGGELVWVPEAVEGGGWWRCLACDFGPVAIDGVGVAFDIAWPWWGSDDRYVVVVDVSDPGEPAVVSHFDLIDRGDESRLRYWTESGPVFLRGNSLIFGFRDGRQVDGRYESWHLVQEIDLGDPASPRRRAPVEVPGLLRHLHQAADGGTVLFTMRQKIEKNDEGRDLWTSTGVLEASAFDGVQAFLLDGVEVEDGAHTATVGSGRFLFKPDGRDVWSPAPTDAAGLRVWEWDGESGSIGTLPAVALASPPRSLHAVDGLVFAFRDGGVDAVDARDLPEAPAVASHDSATLSWWWATPKVELGTGALAAFMPLGIYGVETMDLAGLAASEAAGGPAVAAAEGGEAEPEWTSVAVSGRAIVSAGAHDFIGTLDPFLAWRFQPALEPMSYEVWAAAVFNPGDEPGFVLPLPTDDSDGDGDSNVVEFALGTAADDAASKPVAEFAVVESAPGVREGVFAVLRNPAAAGVLIAPESSEDLATWHAVESFEDGTFLRAIVPADPETGDRRFVRLRVSVEPR